MTMELQPHHQAWLDAHPHRSEAWLRAMLAEGFDVHHMDGSRENNDPSNLVLIEHTDHMMLHGGRTLGRLGPPKKSGPHRATRRRTQRAREQYEATKAALVQQLSGEETPK